jgi:hypothetical protein
MLHRLVAAKANIHGAMPLMLSAERRGRSQNPCGEVIYYVQQVAG